MTRSEPSPRVQRILRAILLIGVPGFLLFFVWVALSVESSGEYCIEEEQGGAACPSTFVGGERCARFDFDGLSAEVGGRTLRLELIPEDVELFGPNSRSYRAFEADGAEVERVRRARHGWTYVGEHCALYKPPTESEP